MKILRPLRPCLRRVLAVAVLRRFLAWLASAIALFALGALLAGFLAGGRILQLGLTLLVLSALPAFLFWPASSRALSLRLRWLDEGSVIESYLEAPPGPARELLRRLSAEAASALPFRAAPRERIAQGLAPLFLAALICLALAESLSLMLHGQALTFIPKRAAPVAAIERSEDSDFSDFATEDPAARRQRREQSLELEQGLAGKLNQGPGGSAAQKNSLPASRRPRPGEEGDFTAPPGSSGPGAQGSGADAGTPTEPNGSGQAPGAGTESAAAPGSQPPSGAAAQPGQSSGQAPQGTQPGSPSGQRRPNSAGGPSQGYDRTGNTGVASPLLDYRTRFASAYAERTGGQMTAGDRLDLGELGALERRYFGSFDLRSDLGLAEDPYTSLLKRRWEELKGGLP